MVTKYGMSEKLGTIAYGNESDEVFIGRTMAQARSYSEDVAGLIDEEVKSIVDRAYARCEEILTRCRPQLELTAQYLLAHETMSGAEFTKVFTDPRPRSSWPCPAPPETSTCVQLCPASRAMGAGQFFVSGRPAPIPHGSIAY